jgi:hypothetical protein
LKVFVAATVVMRRSAISGAATSANLRRRPHRAARIVRAAEEHDLAARRQLLAQGIEVHDVAATGLDQLRVENAPLVGEDDPAKGVVHGRKHDDLVARRAHRLQDQAEPGHDPWRLADPGGVDVQAMATRHPFGKRGRPAARVGVVTIHALGVHLRQSFRHARRCGKIHVRHPHRDGVGRFDAR